MARQPQGRPGRAGPRHNVPGSTTAKTGAESSFLPPFLGTFLRLPANRWLPSPSPAPSARLFCPTASVPPERSSDPNLGAFEAENKRRARKGPSARAPMLPLLSLLFLSKTTHLTFSGAGGGGRHAHSLRAVPRGLWASLSPCQGLRCVRRRPFATTCIHRGWFTSPQRPAASSHCQGAFCLVGAGSGCRGFWGFGQLKLGRPQCPHRLCAAGQT